MKLTITLNYDLEDKRGIWGVMSADTPTVNLLDIAEAFAWAEFDTISRLKQAQVPVEEEEDEET